MHLEAECLIYCVRARTCVLASDKAPGRSAAQTHISDSVGKRRSLICYHGYHQGNIDIEHEVAHD